MNTHSYKYTHAYHIPITTYEKLSRLDLEIHEVSHQECLIVDGDVTFH
jgi:hypothetical protein